MPIIFNRDEFNLHKTRLIKELKRSVFIYPTDTIYGIGCNALDESLVHRIREAKRRATMPFSIIAPSKEWIREHCIIDKRVEAWLDKLPGPYTLVVRLKENHPLPDAVNMGLETIGVRIPAHWFSEVVAEMNVPVITTSANISGEDFMTSLENINPIIRKNADHIIYDGELKGKPSTIIRLDREELEVLER